MGEPGSSPVQPGRGGLRLQGRRIALVLERHPGLAQAACLAQQPQQLARGLGGRQTLGPHIGDAVALGIAAPAARRGAPVR